MKLQIALDDVTLEGALELVKKVRDYIDIIEIGTPFVYEYGMQAVRTMKEHFPDKEILADMKIMDAGYYEAEDALKARSEGHECRIPKSKDLCCRRHPCRYSKRLYRISS